MKKTLTIFGLAVFAVGIAAIFSCGGNPGISEGPFHSTDPEQRYELTVEGGEYTLTYSENGEVVKTSKGEAVRSGDVFTLTNAQSGAEFTVEVSGPYIKGGTLWLPAAERAVIWDKSSGYYSGSGFTLAVGSDAEWEATGYTLAYEDGRESTGTAKRDGGTWTLTHNDEGSEIFTVDIVLNFISEVKGTVYFDDGTTLDPGDIIFDDVGGGAEDGLWEWSCSNDDNLNAYLADAGVVPPLPAIPAITSRTDSAYWTAAYRQTTHAGAKSRISNAIKNGEEKWFWNLGDMAKPEAQRGEKVQTYRPAAYPDTVTGPNGVQVPGSEVLRFIGSTEVSMAGRAWDHGTQFPMVGWMAAPRYINETDVDPATLNRMRRAKGYSFWIKVNSATGGNWAVKTAVMTGDITKLAPERGLEWKHYFGNRQPAAAEATSASNTASGVNISKKANWTGSLAVGVWHQVKVYYDGAPAGASGSVAANSACNIEQDSYIFDYNIERRLAFNKNSIEAFQWQIALQDQVSGAGVSARGGAPYDITNGKYDFNIDFYGLELIE